MKIIWTSIFLWLIALTSFGQETARKNALTLSFGPGSIVRQDLIFSPFVHKDFSLSNLGINYTRETKSYQRINLNYGNYSPMVAKPYDFKFHGEPESAYPHTINFFDLNYQWGKPGKQNKFVIGGYFFTDIQVMNYAYDRITNFGYFATLGIGLFGTYNVQISKHSKLIPTLRLPIFAWLARSPYLVNDDEFIDNISSHSGFKTFTAFLGDGQLTSWNNAQQIDFELNYCYSIHNRWGLGAGYIFEFTHVSSSRNLLSFRNSLNFSTTLKF